ncbi:MAG: hypothetical protein IPK19_20845 [Chloroflexi bacterium]|nr:hypothetical protein [Chloroflexota bacterium]
MEVRLSGLLGDLNEEDATALADGLTVLRDAFRTGLASDQSCATSKSAGGAHERTRRQPVHRNTIHRQERNVDCCPSTQGGYFHV